MKINEKFFLTLTRRLPFCAYNPMARPKFYLVALKSFRNINMLRTKHNQNDIFKWCVLFERIGRAYMYKCIYLCVCCVLASNPCALNVTRQVVKVN